MGEVYRARDTRLGRDVAIKILSHAFTADPDRLARFEREARLLASLNHPNVATIHGVEESDGVLALVMEFVEGETLSDRLTRGPVPQSEALGIARQIADALDTAHGKGIIHRDLKPGNVMLSREGVVKVLDFGLAKALAGDGSPHDLSMVTMDRTEEGLVLGTPSYMSPEQARGHIVDKRTDIWAFGCVLFEILCGRRAFSGATLSDTIATILTREPDWDQLPAAIPAGVSRLLRRCLEKDPKRRLRDIGDARIELDDARSQAGDESGGSQQARGITRRTAIAALAGTAAGAVATGAFAIRRYRDDATPRNVTRFAIAMPEGEVHNASHNCRLGISRDGRRIAFNTVGPNGIRLYVRSLGDLEARLLKEAGEGFTPVFSPDDRSLLFVASRQIRKVALSGGAPATVCTIGSFAGTTWADDQTIYFVSEVPGGILRVPANGGQPASVVEIDVANGERVLKFPHALPGGKAVLFTAAPADAESFDDAHIAVVSTASGTRKTLVEGGTFARFASGHLVYARNGSLLAVAFDPDRLEVSGQPFTVLDGLHMSRNTGAANFDIAANGDLAYIPGRAEGGARTLHWVDRSGKAEQVPLPSRSYLHPRLSPDGLKLAIEIEGSDHNVYVYDFRSGVIQNITTDGVSHWPVWSPDGLTIGYRAGPMGRFQLWQVPADRSQAPAQVPATGVSQSAESYSPDGRAIAYTTSDPNAPSRITVVPLDGDRTPRPLDDSSTRKGHPNSRRTVGGSRTVQTSPDDPRSTSRRSPVRER